MEQDSFNKLIANATGNPFSLTQTEEEELANLAALELLNPKQQAFCQYYVECFNAAKAALDAGYSPTSCASIGYSLLRRPEVQAYIESLRQIKSHKYRHTVLDELSSLYQQCKQGEIQYSVQKDEDGTMIAKPIMRQNADGTLVPHTSTPNYKIALDTLRTLAEYTIPKPTNPLTEANNKLQIANNYIQKNTFVNKEQSKIMQDHINSVINKSNKQK